MGNGASALAGLIPRAQRDPRARARYRVRVVDVAPIGITGLKQSGGIINEEWQRQLQGRKGREAIREMTDSNYVIGGILFAINNLIAHMDWRVDPGLADGAEVPTPAYDEAARFVDSCRQDMATSWQNILSEVLTFVPYGYAPLEFWFKRRLGMEATPPSKYDDGKFGWADWELRSQDSLNRWEFGPKAELLGMWQDNPTGAAPPMLPVERFLLFRTTAAKGNPEGKSALRAAYRPHYFMKHLEEIEAIGVERDMAGLPVAHVPVEILSPTATAEQAAVLTAIKQIVTNIRVDAEGGVVWPSEFDEKGNQLYRLELLSTGGTRSFDTNAIIRRYQAAIGMALLADFIVLGHEGVGSFALADSKTSLFGYAIGAFADQIADVINEVAIPALLRANGMPTVNMPRISHGDVENADLEKLAKFISDMAGKGLITPDGTLEAFLREIAGLPPIDEDSIRDIPESTPPGAQDAAPDDEAEAGGEDLDVLPPAEDEEGAPAPGQKGETT